MSSPLQPLAYTALERIRVPRPVDRLDWIAGFARDKTVFDLGALDETAYQKKQSSDTWLHARLSAVARTVVGFDNSRMVPPDGLQTGPNSRIINHDIFRLGDAVGEYGVPDVVVAGELIEHLPDAGCFLASLRDVPALQDATFVMSTPNACSWHNWMIGLASMESTHEDHLAIYSYKVLRTVFERNGFEVLTLQPYHARFHEMLATSSGVARIATRAFQGAVNLGERLAPVLSGGWIVIARIARPPTGA